MRKYHQLTRQERYQIEKLMQEGKTVAQIANSLGFHRSTIYREKKRNSKNSGEYSAKEAWRKVLSRKRRQDFGPRIKIKDWVEERILDFLSKGWSPETISGRLKLEQNFSLSHEAIYKYILKDREYGGTLYKCLRRRGRRHRFRKKSRFLVHWEPRKGIEERPESANDRTEEGHWERDLMLSAKSEGGLIVFTDRKDRLTVFDRVESKSSQESLEKTVNLFKDRSELPCKTVTNDNGPEFARHQELENDLGIEVYFARPYAAWQRGSNENAIGLIRQFIPKGTDISKIKDDRLREIESAINNRPRKMFGYRTPYEIRRGTEDTLCPKERHWRYEQQALQRLG